MSIRNNIKGKAVIRRTAQHYDMPTAEVRAEIQKCLDDAWNTDDPAVKQAQEKLFPEGKPTMEEFICRVAAAIKREQSQGH